MRGRQSIEGSTVNMGVPQGAAPEPSAARAAHVADAADFNRIRSVSVYVLMSRPGYLPGSEAVSISVITVKRAVSRGAAAASGPLSSGLDGPRAPFFEKVSPITTLATEPLGRELKYQAFYTVSRHSMH
ncbi:hypothetical protein EVAR_90589_1 [Eumeta japonica]|uniref:Uncharacterized protein n=1 Tax=Eumeta variegata TaxID=151549 RepID=A0A4C2A335_EUMVA|nr:hypothetical protein EVAR_90589_1 [Eumeta japonica]